MFAETLLYEALDSYCPFIHENRLNAVMDVAYALRNSNNLSLSEMGRNLSGGAKVKNKIKKVNRLEGNKKLHQELFSLYQGLSDFIFTYLSQNKTLPIVVDVCFMKDDRAIQMLSAEVASKGRSIPVYREVFKEGELKGRAQSFLSHVKACLPPEREVIVIMDAGFYEDWFDAIESFNWHWVCRVRQGKTLKLSEESEWQTVKELIPQIKERTANYERGMLTKRHKRVCRIVTTRKMSKGRKVKVSRGKTTSKLGSGRYRSSGREPWILANNLPAKYKGADVVKMYSKRMQIEESFRDVKSHQFGLSGRYIRTTCTHRWGVKMLLAAITQITYWVIGVIAHSQDKQRYFQANTVRDKKVFSYFTLGRLMIEHNQLDSLAPDDRPLSEIIAAELSRKW